MHMVQPCDNTMVYRGIQGLLEQLQLRLRSFA